LLSSFTQYHWIKLSPIVQNSPLLAKKPGPYLSPSVADRPLRPAKDHRLGKPLPYQQPNPTQAHLKAVLNLFLYLIFSTYFNMIISNF